MAIETMDDLLVHELRDLYNAEKQLVQALPKMAKAATDEELVAAIENHLSQTQEQVARLEVHALPMHVRDACHEARWIAGRVVLVVRIVVRRGAVPEHDIAVLDRFVVGDTRSFEVLAEEVLIRLEVTDVSAVVQRVALRLFESRHRKVRLREPLLARD